MNSSFYASVDDLIRNGRVGEAVLVLRSLELKKIERKDYAKIAALARRAGVPQLTVRLLNSVVRQQKGVSLAPATPSELAEYAMGLALLGVIPEALEILSRIDPDHAPERLLYQSFALILEWRYEEAIPLLERYMNYPIPEYQRLVARVNLAAALVHGRKVEFAKEQIATTIAEAKRAKVGRLLGNAHEIAAQLALSQGDVPSARRSLSEAARLLVDAGAWDRCVLNKWDAICALVEDKNPENARRLLRVRDEAVQLRQRETIRDLDRHLGVYGGSAEHLIHVCFGTSLPHFRRRILDDRPVGFELPESYLWRPSGNPGESVSREFDFQSRRNTDPQSVILAFLGAMSSDFYRSFRPGLLFSLLFQDQYFNPISSPHRVHELVRRARLWLKRERIPVEILQADGEYVLAAEVSIGIRIELDCAIPTPLEASLANLRQRFGAETFTTSSAAKVLEKSPRTARRILTQALSAGSVEGVDINGTRIYRFPAKARAA